MHKFLLLFVLKMHFYMKFKIKLCDVFLYHNWELSKPTIIILKALLYIVKEVTLKCLYKMNTGHHFVPVLWIFGSWNPHNGCGSQ